MVFITVLLFLLLGNSGSETPTVSYCVQPGRMYYRAGSTSYDHYFSQTELSSISSGCCAVVEYNTSTGAFSFDIQNSAPLVGGVNAERVDLLHHRGDIYLYWRL